MTTPAKKRMTNSSIGNMAQRWSVSVSSPSVLSIGKSFIFFRRMVSSNTNAATAHATSSRFCEPALPPSSTYMMMTNSNAINATMSCDTAEVFRKNQALRRRRASRQSVTTPNANSGRVIRSMARKG